MSVHLPLLMLFIIYLILWSKTSETQIGMNLRIETTKSQLSRQGSIPIDLRTAVRVFNHPGSIWQDQNMISSFRMSIPYAAIDLFLDWMVCIPYVNYRWATYLYHCNISHCFYLLKNLDKFVMKFKYFN